MIGRFRKAIRRLFAQEHISGVSQQVREHKITYLTPKKIHNLEQCINDVARRKVDGLFIEAGVALGGSAIIIASLMPEGRYFRGFDVFEMIPPPSDNDDEKAISRYQIIASGQSQGIGGDTYYGYMNDLYSRVVENFHAFGIQVDGVRVSLHRGLFEDTMHFAVTDKVALAHIDCDWYEPVMTSLERIHPVLRECGYIIVDDYNDYGGCRRAVDEFLESHADLHVIRDDSNLVLQYRTAEVRSDRQ